MIRLLDVNLLIALIDPSHVHHGIAHDWFERTGQTGWATCPLTENGAVRIASNRSYSLDAPAPRVVADSVASLRSHERHVFWADDISLIECDLIDLDRVGTPAQVTDTYLLALAVSKDERLATLDRRLIVTAVKGGAEALEIIA